MSRADPFAGVELVTGALLDEILARLIEQVDAPWPESMPAQMRAMEAFRAELRDLFARAGEAGLDAHRLEEAGNYNQHVYRILSKQTREIGRYKVAKSSSEFFPPSPKTLGLLYNFCFLV